MTKKLNNKDEERSLSWKIIDNFFLIVLIVSIFYFAINGHFIDKEFYIVEVCGESTPLVYHSNQDLEKGVKLTNNELKELIGSVNGT